MLASPRFGAMRSLGTGTDRARKRYSVASKCGARSEMCCLNASLWNFEAIFWRIKPSEMNVG